MSQAYIEDDWHKASDGRASGTGGERSWPEQLRSALRESLRFITSSPFYRLSLKGAAPLHALVYPPNLSYSSLRTAKDLSEGRYRFAAGRKSLAAGSVPWTDCRIVPAKDENWLEEMHSFSWLHHLTANKKSDGRILAAELLDSWIRFCPVGTPVAWRAHVIGRRLVSWLQCGPGLIEDADPVWQTRVFKSVAEQTRHLARFGGWGSEGYEAITATAGLLTAALCFSELSRYLEVGYGKLERLVLVQILEDGGHVSRSPKVHFQILMDLVMLVNVISARNATPPDWMGHVIERMAAFAKLIRHGDGRLPLFNGSGESENATIDQVLGRDEVRARMSSMARASGFYKLKRGRTNVLIDAGRPNTPDAEKEAHGGCLSFEFSVGRHRLVVNCGSGLSLGREWGDAMRRTAAQSTLSIDEADSCHFYERPGLFHRSSLSLADGPFHVRATFDHQKDASLFEGSHDGYLSRAGFVHHRRLVLSSTGEEFQGEDVLERRVPPRLRRRAARLEELPGKSFTVRFHLHPDVQVSHARDRESLLLKLLNGDGWRFRAEGAAIDLEESVYIGTPGRLRKTQQIVLRGVINGPQDRVLKVRWRFGRLGSEGSKKPGDGDGAAPQLPLA